MIIGNLLGRPMANLHEEVLSKDLLIFFGSENTMGFMPYTGLLVHSVPGTDPSGELFSQIKNDYHVYIEWKSKLQVSLRHQG
jgi:hypothetical protein